MTKHKVALLVLSFDGYDDLWNMTIELFNKNWPDCEFDKYLMTNYKEYIDNNQRPFKTLKIGQDCSWSKNLIKALDKLYNYEYVFLFMDDGFLINKIDNKLILKIFHSFKNSNGKFLSYLNEPKSNKKYNEYFGEISRHSPYRVTATSALWKIEFLKNFLDEKEDAWMFEKLGSRRSEKYESGFYSVYKNHFHFIHGIIKGLWLPDAHKKLSAMGYNLSKKNRGTFSQIQIIKFKIYIFFRNLILLLTPLKLKKYWIRLN